MAEESYGDYLADRVLAEGQPVGLRRSLEPRQLTLRRSPTACSVERSRCTSMSQSSRNHTVPFIDTPLTPLRMLYEFHAKQTAKTPESVHATYLLIGKKPSSEHSNGIGAHDGHDTAMRSSPFMSSLPEPPSTPEDPVSTTSIVLVREEELESMWYRWIPDQA
jgi:hypothetical protein